MKIYERILRSSGHSKEVFANSAFGEIKTTSRNQATFSFKASRGFWNCFVDSCAGRDFDLDLARLTSPVCSANV
jgi:hypothetical protein